VGAAAATAFVEKKQGGEIGGKKGKIVEGALAPSVLAGANWGSERVWTRKRRTGVMKTGVGGTKREQAEWKE